MQSLSQGKAVEAVFNDLEIEYVKTEGPITEKLHAHVRGTRINNYFILQSTGQGFVALYVFPLSTTHIIRCKSGI